MQYFNETFSDEMHKFHCCRECADWSPGCQRARQVHAGDLDDAPEGDSGEHACGQRDCGNCKRVGNPELGQQGRKRPEATQAIERQDASSCPDIATPFFVRLSKAPNYTPGELAYILTRKALESGGFEGLAHLYVHCPATSLPSVPAVTRRAATYSASAASSRRATSSMRMASPCLAPATERPMSTPMPVM